MESERSKVLFEIVRTVVTVAIALLLAFVFILIVSKEPSKALYQFMVGPFLSVRNMGNVIELSIPFIFTGIAACIMFQARQFNMIGEGAFFFGGIMATVVALKITLPMGIHPIVAILMGGIAGAVSGYFIGYCKAKWGANEFVNSLMFNYVLLYAGLYMLINFLRDPKKGQLSSFLIPDSAQLPKIVDGTRIHVGLFIAIIAVILTYLFMYKTKWGYAIRMTGFNAKFVAYSGINVAAAIVISQVAGGFLAGIGGATQILGMHQRFEWSTLTGYGFDGIIVATLARLNPAFVPVAALFLAFLRTGADIMARNSDVPSEVVLIIQAIMIILISASGFMAKWRQRMIARKSKHAEEQGAIAC
ncbi:ABC transporter permease [Paenibacillus pectinilyticus]|uniref:ABC transporter permease n=1 Tax=Paenibacillus pectinilyticus TaxID=512399 RepID=A0A1C1A2I5_9BACL|nr:ABC transporter permease [Paenibacillus pectinilyticus]OCT14737.1 ABC transporter permease [Paenibacillus pectinilyticus]